MRPGSWESSMPIVHVLILCPLVHISVLRPWYRGIAWMEANHESLIPIQCFGYLTRFTAPRRPMQGPKAQRCCRIPRYMVYTSLPTRSIAIAWMSGSAAISSLCGDRAPSSSFVGLARAGPALQHEKLSSRAIAMVRRLRAASKPVADCGARRLYAIAVLRLDGKFSALQCPWSTCSIARCDARAEHIRRVLSQRRDDRWSSVSTPYTARSP
ncbi:hypothetical protein DFH09DRAFT_1076606 [Mycena vulgaris]|nr:hypothetical protein DFH09DRAFT_1076606 [Mycena vulgaris]